MGLLTSSTPFFTRSKVGEIAVSITSSLLLYYTFRYIVASIEPGRETRLERNKKSKAVLSRLGVADLELTEHEASIAAEVIHPDDMRTRFDDVGGLTEIIDHLREAIVFPLVFPRLGPSELLGPPRGVLLYGPPGCGKTMLAKALAKESGARFINIRASVLQDKWYGESNKLIAALFSLARKLEPSIIFIDEIDAFMRERSRGDHEMTALAKAEFMQAWDGLTSGNDRILVLGATNRPNDIDGSFLRRMPKRFGIKLPDASQRRSILQLILRDIKLEKGFDMDILVARTNGLSGSDLKECCRAAAMVATREAMRSLTDRQGPEALEKAKQEGFTIRPLRITDFTAVEAGGTHSNTSLAGFGPSRTGFIEADGLD